MMPIKLFQRMTDEQEQMAKAFVEGDICAYEIAEMQQEKLMSQYCREMTMDQREEWRRVILRLDEWIVSQLVSAPRGGASFSEKEKSMAATPAGAVQIGYRPSAASSFATLARGEPNDKCGYCGNHGDGGQMMMVEGYLIPRHHIACRDEILQGREPKCNCPDFTGDSNICPVPEHQYLLGR